MLCNYKLCHFKLNNIINLKAKVVLLHAMKALWWRGGIVPTHSKPQHSMGVSGQHHALAALYPHGKGPPVPIVQEAGLLIWYHMLHVTFFFNMANESTEIIFS
jgi:hypothetical protein